MTAQAWDQYQRIEAFGLEILVRGAERSRSDRSAFIEQGPGANFRILTYRDLAKAVDAFAQLAVESGLRPKDRAIILGLNRIQTGVAVMGLLAAGVEPILTPASADAAMTAKIARMANAITAFTEMRYGDLDCQSLIQESARAADLSWIGALSGPHAPHFIQNFWRNFSLDALLSFEGARSGANSGGNAARIGLTRLEEDGSLALDYYHQDELLGKAIGLLGKLGATAQTPIVSLLSPASVSGLVGGLVMGLLTGAPLYFFGPFESSSFLTLVNELDRYCLLAPAGAVPDLEADGILVGSRLIGLGVAGDGDAPQNDRSFHYAKLDGRE